MKILIHSFLILSLLDLLLPTKPKTTLHELMTITNTHDYQVEYGELTIKESFNNDQLETLTKKITQAGFTEHESTTPTELKKYQRQISHELTEHVTIIATNDQREMTVNYHLFGDVNQVINTRKYDHSVTSFIDKIYTHQKRDYACVSLTSHAMIGSDDFFGKLQENLQYEEIDRITELGFTVISAYSNKMSQAIPMKDKQMNMQISVRTGSNQQTRILIGTPILTAEY